MTFAALLSSKASSVLKLKTTHVIPSTTSNTVVYHTTTYNPTRTTTMYFRRPFRILSVGATIVLVIMEVALLSPPADAWMGNNKVPQSSLSSPSSTPRKFLSQQQKQEMTRRKLVQSFIVSTAGVAVMGAKKHVAHAASDDELPNDNKNKLYQRQIIPKQSHSAYQIILPNNGATFSETQKPVKTHLDEVNLVSGEIKGYQYGITVDPVRINSLKEVRGDVVSSCQPSFFVFLFFFNSLTFLVAWIS